MKTNSIWHDILLKEVYGFELKNTVTIGCSENKCKRKYQIFEILVVETLAFLDSTTTWQATFGNKDYGVDIIGKRKSPYATPFCDKTPDQLYLGQIKRRNSGYRYDDFRTDINKLFEFYSSKVLYKDATLMQLIFVISSDNANNTSNLRKNLMKDFETKEHLLFVAGIKAPIVIIDALDIIKYWKLNFGFVRNIIEGIFSPKQLSQFEEILNRIEFSGVSVSVSQNRTAGLGKIQELRLRLTADIKDIPIETYLKWIPANDSLDKIQLISPWSLYENPGIHAYIENTYELLVLFRGISVGEHMLGELEVAFANSTYKQRIPLGKIFIEENPFPVYLELPNHNVKTNLEKMLMDKKCSFYACSILGCGGIGKSSLLSEVVIKAVNNGFYCINIEYSHNFTCGNCFPIQLIVKLLNYSIHRIIFNYEIIAYIRTFLGGLYKEEWEDALKNLIEDKVFDIEHVCACIISLLIKLTWHVPCIIWFSDMHWLNSTNADLLRKIHFSLKNNSNYINQKLMLLFEGRNNETLFFDNRYHIPYVWEEFLKETDIESQKLRNWKNEECKEFLDTLFYHKQENNDKELLDCVKNELLRTTNGVPMHIFEQIKFLIEQGKIVVKNNGELYVFEHNWKQLLSDDLMEVVNFRIQYYYQKNKEIMEYLIIYVKLNLNIIPACAKYIYKMLSRNFATEIGVLENMSFIEIKDSIIYFQHEYYSECLKKLPMKNNETLDNILQWFLNKKTLTSYEYLCKLQLLEMYLFVDYDNLCNEIITFLTLVSDEYMKQEAYKMLLEIPEDILQRKKMTLYKIKYELCESIILTGDWKLAKKYFLELIESINFNNPQEVYYGALAYQDLSNISSGELLLDESIMYANKGLELIENTIDAFNKQDIYDCIMQAQELLIERKAICHQFSGHLDKALELQKKAYESAMLRRDTYVMLRVDYERGSTNLHVDLNNAVNVLTSCYKKAALQHMQFPEEQVLIKTMELVGKTQQIYLSDSEEDINDVYHDAIFLAEHQQINKFNYSASIHLITIAALILRKENNPQKALKYLFKSLERALDAHLNELLWKSYLNIAQIKEYLDCHDEAEYYALKASEILENMIQKNPENRDAIISLIHEPLKCLKNILKKENEWLKDEILIPNRLKIHSFTWKTVELFVMN